MDIVIRPAEPKDIEAIHLLMRQLWPDKAVTKYGIARIFEQRMQSSVDVGLCAEVGGEVVGYCSFCRMLSFWQEGYVGFIPEFVVEEGFRGRGIGKALMEAMIKVAKDSNCKMIELDSDFHREAAHKFYEGWGFAKRAFMFSKEL